MSQCVCVCGGGGGVQGMGWSSKSDLISIYIIIHSQGSGGRDGV